MDEQERRIYDLFVSYAQADRAWVEGYLLDALNQIGVCCHSEAAFDLGVPRISEFERAVQESARTLLVLSPAYLAEGFTRFTDLLAQSYGLETATWPVIPLILHPVKLPPRLAMLTALDATDPAEWPAVVERLCAELQRPIPGPAPRPPCPYPGMVPFSEADSERFFGRDREVQELLERLRLHPFLTVIGPSGSGKSSLVFAGLVPALRESGLFGDGEWLVRSVRPGEVPMDALANALDSAPSTGSGQAPANPGWVVSDLLAAHLDAGRLLLVVDQFEELFTLARSDVEPFQRALVRLGEIPNCYIVLTVRADFYSDLMACPLWREIQAHRFEVLPLDDDGLRQAIVRPAEDVGVFVETAMVERLVADAAGEPGILPLVQETLVLLWEKVDRRYLPLRAYDALVLSARDYRELGGVQLTGLQVAMARRADATLADLTPEQQFIARRIFLRLVQFGEGRADTRRQQSAAALRVASDDPELLNHTLEHLTGNRLLTLSGEEEGVARRVDIAHESLITGWPTLQEWLTERREAEQTRRRLEAKAVEWVRLGQGRGGLLDSVELAEAEGWLNCIEAAELGWSTDLRALVATSRQEIEKERQASEAARQREREQARALAESEGEQEVIRTRWSRILVGLVGTIALLLTLTVLSFLPVDTRWQPLTSLNLFIGAMEQPRDLVVAVNATDPDVIYVSDRSIGGLYRSLDGGLSWSNIGNASLAAEPVSSIAAASQMVYIITPSNIFVSENGGRDWASTGLSLDGGSDRQPEVIAVNPGNSRHAYIGTRQAELFVTTDGGATWSQFAIEGIAGDHVQALATNGQHVVLATDRGLWISDDMAKTWRPMEGEPTIPPVLGLAMPGKRGRFLMALGEEGIGDADVSNHQWIALSDQPSASSVKSVTASGGAHYAGSENELFCRRLWHWTSPNWWRWRLGLRTPCSPPSTTSRGILERM